MQNVETERLTLTSNEIAKILGISISKFYQIAKTKTWFVPLPQLRRRKLYPATQLENFLKQTEPKKETNATHTTK